MQHSLKSFVVITTLLSLNAAPVWATAEQNSETKTFQLKADFADAMQLSRSDLVDMTAQAQMPTAKQKPFPDESALNEYNVDWSRWISHLADRWFYVLDSTEKLINIRFVTMRPAAIEFTCYANGQIANIQLRQSSGNPTYDKLQMLALKEIMPLPPFPRGTRRTSITLVQGWESHVAKQGERDYTPGSFGKGFPMEKVTEWVSARRGQL